MHRDPEMTWEGEFPYDTLAPAGITPNSSIRDIQNCIGFFAKRGLATEAQPPRSLLKQVDNRLFFDFFLYRWEPPEIKEMKSNDKEK